MMALMLVLLSGATSQVDPRATARSLAVQMAAQMDRLPPAKVGQWVTYQLNGGGERNTYWRLAIVGAERDSKGRDALWLEVDIGTHPQMASPLLQMRFLYAARVGLNVEGVTRAYLGYGFEKPVELDEGATAQMFLPADGAADQVRDPRPAAAANLKVVTRVGALSRLVTAAGSISATPIEILLRQTVVKRMWVSAQVPVLGLAKLELPGIGHIMEVRDFGVDARPQMVTPSPGTAKVGLERYHGFSTFPPDEAPP
jgi:hypothetical protein